MGTGAQEWWTQEKVETTVTKHFIYSHLRSDDAERLTHPVFADLSDNSFLECILEKARRLFLILIHLGVSGDILRLIEDSYDDDNLPIDEADVASLNLSRGRSQNINSQFYRCQFKYLVRVVGEGEHIRYAEDERVPLERVEGVTQHGLDRVRLPSPINRVFAHKTIHLEDRSEFEILSEIAAAKHLSGKHVPTIFGSFIQDEKIHVLLSPAAKHDLGQFLSDRPKAFEAMSKPERRAHYVRWPHCLANALHWLHDQGVHHGAVRPSRIRIDEQYQISLGQFEGDWVLGSVTPVGDLESYQYAAPELWRRGLSVQAQTGTGSSLGGRSAVGRRDAPRYLAGPRRSDDLEQIPTRDFSLTGESTYTFVPTFKGVSSRLKLEMATKSDRLERADSIRHDQVVSPMESVRRISSFRGRFGSTSSGSSDKKRFSNHTQSERIYSIPSETKNTAVQTWKSTADNLPATDVFGLAAVMMDMLTVLCSRSVSSFAKHRSSKNRQAGRGGGLADSSFHANLPQVGTWAENLHKDAEKKLRKESGDIYRVVGPLLQIVMQCLDREPRKRISALSLARRLERHLIDLNLHCSADDHADEGVTSSAVSRSVSVSMSNQPLSEDQGSTSKASGSSFAGPFTPSGSYVSTVSHQRVPSGIASRTGDYVLDPYLPSDLDLQEADSYYVRITPKDKAMISRLHKDFTVSEHTSRASSVTSARNLHTVSKTRSNHVTFSELPPATPPPDRQLPTSPATKGRSRTSHSTRFSPLDNVYEANDLLAGTLGDMPLEDRFSRASTDSAYVDLDAYQDGEWKL